jgi:hypothetical protein
MMANAAPAPGAIVATATKRAPDRVTVFLARLWPVSGGVESATTAVAMGMLLGCFRMGDLMANGYGGDPTAIAVSSIS